MEFDGRLYETIDPDALDALYQSADTNVRVEFTYMGYEITIRHDGGIHVDSPDG